MQSLNRIVAILTVVADSADPVTPVRVAGATNLSLSTVARVMRDMADEDLLERHASQGTYILGRKLFALTQRAARNGSSNYGINSVLAHVRDVTGETTSLHVRSKGLRLCIAAAESRHEVRSVMSPGVTMPLIESATGDVLLACAPDGERESSIDAAQLNTSERRELLARLEDVRARGYALNVNSPRNGMTGLAVAVRHGHDTIAALLVSGPGTRYTDQMARDQIDFVCEEAERLGAVMPASI